MKSLCRAIDVHIKEHIKIQIDKEIMQNIEDSIFFSSHTIGFEVFKNATQKLKKLLRSRNFDEIGFLNADARKFITQNHLPIVLDTPEYHYVLRALLKAQIQINEAIMNHFPNLCKGAHSLDYLENRAQEIYRLLQCE